MSFLSDDFIKEVNKSYSVSTSYIDDKTGRQKTKKSPAVFKGGTWENSVVNVTPTGLISLDKLLGVGGFPGGRIMNLAGLESSGKTTLCVFYAAQVTRRKQVVLWVNSEAVFDMEYAVRCGVDMEYFMITNPELDAEGAVQVIRKAIKNGCGLVVVDSFNALLTESELKALDAGGKTIGKKAQFWADNLPFLQTELSKDWVTDFIFIHQMRVDMNAGQYGFPYTITGGTAVKFYATFSFYIISNSVIKKGSDGPQIGQELNILSKKNKLSTPRQKVRIPLMFPGEGYGCGICPEYDLVGHAVDAGVMTQKGAFFYLDDVVVGQGQLNVTQFFQDNPEVFKEVYNKTKAIICPIRDDDPADEEE